MYILNAVFFIYNLYNKRIYINYKIEKLNEVFKPTVEMEKAWEECHSEYTEKAAWIKTMLNM